MTQPSIIDALATWSEWHADVAPTGPTGSYALDMQLADAFRYLVFLDQDNARLGWIERQIFGRHDVPPPDCFAATLTKWWLDIFNEQQRRIAA